MAHDLGFQGIKPRTAFKTSWGNRFVDRLVNGVAHEAKAGINVGLDAKNRLQILKDAELIASGQVRGVVWHFYQGAQESILTFLTEHKNKYVVH